MRRAGGRFAKLEVDGRVVNRVELATSNGERRKGLMAGSTVRPTGEEA